MSIASLAHPPRLSRRAAMSRRVAAGFLGLAYAIVLWIGRELRVRRDMRRLSEFDDFMLRDIGIARSDLEGAIRNGRDRP